MVTLQNVYGLPYAKAADVLDNTLFENICSSNPEYLENNTLEYIAGAFLSKYANKK